MRTIKKSGLRTRILTFMLSLMIGLALGVLNSITVEAAADECPYCVDGLVCSLNYRFLSLSIEHSHKCTKEYQGSVHGSLDYICPYCNGCGYVNCDHSESNINDTFSADAVNHWNEYCNTCGSVVNKTAHTDSDDDGLCDVCFYSFSKGKLPSDDRYYLRISSVPPYGGTVNYSGVGCAEGQSITITATPNDGYVFKGWYSVKVDMSLDTCLSTDCVYSIVPSDVRSFGIKDSMSNSINGGAPYKYTRYIYAVFEEAHENDIAAITGCSVSLREDISLNVNVVVSETTVNDAIAYLSVTAEGVETKLAFDSAMNAGAMNYVFSIKVAPKDYEQDMVVKVVTAAGESDSLTVSLGQYMDCLINSLEPASGEYKLVNSVKEYCLAAKTYFSGGASAGIYDYDEYILKLEKSSVPEATFESEGYIGTCLLLEDKVKIRHYYKGESGEIIGTTSEALTPWQYGRADENNYTVYTYMLTVLKSESTDNALKNLVCAMIDYSMNAQMYVSVDTRV